MQVMKEDTSCYVTGCLRRRNLGVCEGLSEEVMYEQRHVPWEGARCGKWQAEGAATAKVLSQASWVFLKQEKKETTLQRSTAWGAKGAGFQGASAFLSWIPQAGPVCLWIPSQNHVVHHVKYRPPQMALVAKKLPASAGHVRDMGSVPGSGPSPEGGPVFLPG